MFQKFDALVMEHKGAPLNDYTLRLIGSDTEHFIRKLLQASVVCRAPPVCLACTATAGRCTHSSHIRCALSLCGKHRTMRREWPG